MNGEIARLKLEIDILKEAITLLQKEIWGYMCSAIGNAAFEKISETHEQVLCDELADLLGEPRFDDFGSQTLPNAYTAEGKAARIETLQKLIAKKEKKLREYEERNSEAELDSTAQASGETGNPE